VASSHRVMDTVGCVWKTQFNLEPIVQTDLKTSRDVKCRYREVVSTGVEKH
jgi:hypothetical protein